jgi:hypothetical protein
VPNLFQRNLSWIYENFKKDTSKMLIVTGTLGWALSSLAQGLAVLANPKISNEKKSFLLPQELMDAVVNVGGFFCFTMLTKKCIAKMAKTGKIAPESVRKFLNSNKEYKDKVGKLDFNLDEVLKSRPEYAQINNSYLSHKNFVTTMGTIGASVFSCNMITPVIRNFTASNVQKTYIDMQKNPKYYEKTNSNGMKI